MRSTVNELKKLHKDVIEEVKIFDKPRAPEDCITFTELLKRTRDGGF